MRDRELHDALLDFARDVSALLSRELADGADLPFEVLGEDERTRPAGRRSERRAVLYRYRPLTDAFIAPRWAAIRALESFTRAAATLGSGAASYLRHRGLRAADADAALHDLVERLFDDATSFELQPERFERLYAELDATVGERTVRASVVAPLHGVRIHTGRVDLGEGLALVRRGRIDAPPTALEGAVRAGEPTAQADDADVEAVAEPAPSPLDVLCVLERELPAHAPLPVDDARREFRRTLTALRLCGAGGTALGPLAWARAGAGAWHPVALGVSSRSRPASWELRHGDESEVRDLLEILSLSRHAETTAWALGRFEMGCDRELEAEALSDYLLGLRALLGEPGPVGEHRVAARLAALCSPQPERAEARRRVELAFALERELMHGASGGTLALDSPSALVRDVEQHLRALLRDVLCAYLPEDLHVAADEVAAESAAAARASALEAEDRASAADAPGDEIEVHDTRAQRRDEQPTEELEAIDPAAVDALEAELVGAAVTPSIDWEAEG